MTVAQPQDADRRERSNLVAGAIVLLLLVIGAGVAVLILRGGFGGDNGVLRTVFLPGIPQVARSAEILYQGQHVGEVERSHPPQVGLQLIVTASLIPEVTDVVTLFPGQRIELSDPAGPVPLVIALSSVNQAEIRSGAAQYQIVREAANRWRIDSPSGAPGLTVNGRTARPGQPIHIQTGDQLAVGAIQIEWQDLQEISRLSVRIALDRLRKAAGLPDSTGEPYLLGPRSSLGLTSTFGLGKPGLRLEPDFGRTPFVRRPDSVIALSPSADLEQTIQGMLVYLNSPGAIRREPATRFERVVSDLNRSLEQIAAVSGQMQSLVRRADAVAGEQGGRGMVGRLVLEPRTLDTLHAVAARLAILTAPLADTTRSVMARLKLDTLESGVTTAVTTLTSTFHRVDTTAIKVSGVADSLQSVVGLARGIVKDSLPPAIGRVSGLLDQGSGAAKAAKVAVPAALLSGIAAALVGILKMFGVF